MCLCKIVHTSWYRKSHIYVILLSVYSICNNTNVTYLNGILIIIITDFLRPGVQCSYSCVSKKAPMINWRIAERIESCFSINVSVEKKKHIFLKHFIIKKEEKPIKPHRLKQKQKKNKNEENLNVSRKFSFVNEIEIGWHKDNNKTITNSREQNSLVKKSENEETDYNNNKSLTWWTKNRQHQHAIQYQCFFNVYHRYKEKFLQNNISHIHLHINSYYFICLRFFIYSFQFSF